MNSIAFCIFILHLIILQSEAASGNLFQALTGSDPLWETLKIFIKNCFTKYFGTFIMIGNWTTDERIILHELFSNAIPVNLMTINEINIFQKHQCFRGFFKINETVVKTRCKPASNVTILVSSNTTLLNILENLRTSVWWNSEAYFLLVNADAKNGCRSAREFLKVIWEYKILSALYFCKNIHGRVIVYSFNPFAQIGTDIWNVVKVDSNESTRWTLLQFYEIHDRKCDDFDFDKTRNLDKYNIRIASVIQFKDLKKDVLHIIFKTLNAIPTIKYYDTFGFVAKNGPVGFLKDIDTGMIDFVGLQMFARSYWKMMTDAIGTSGICIVSRKYHVPFAKRFMSIFTVQVWLCLFGTGLLSIVTLKCIFDQPIADLSMEFLRIFTATPSLRSPTSSRSRFFLLNILYLIFIMNLYIQSRLYAMLTAPDYTPAIDSPDDLIKSNLPIYGPAHHRQYVSMYRELCERYQEIQDNLCWKRLVNKEKLVCLIHSDALIGLDLVDSEIHKARINLFDGPTAYTFPEDWPLAPKVNTLLLHVNEMGIFKISEEQVKNNDKTAEQNIDMKQMTFCFLLFFWSCVLSVCTFFVELIVYKLEKSDQFQYFFIFIRKICQYIVSRINYLKDLLF